MKRVIKVKSYLRKGRLVRKHARVVKNRHMDISEISPKHHYADGDDFTEMQTPKHGRFTRYDRLAKNLRHDKRVAFREDTETSSPFNVKSIGDNGRPFRETFKSHMIKKRGLFGPSKPSFEPEFRPGEDIYKFKTAKEAGAFADRHGGAIVQPEKEGQPVKVYLPRPDQR